jgi:DNA-binding NarL/FixJ family response regulator
MPPLAETDTHADDRPADHWLPGSLGPEQSAAAQLTSTMMLVADPDPATADALSASLLDLGVGHVHTVHSTVSVDGILADRGVGDLAIISLRFGDPANRLIHGLREMGWPRVIALATTPDPGPLQDAFHAGATGILRSHETTPDPDPAPNLELSARELDVLRLVADGRSNTWIGRQLSLTAFTVKRDLALIGRKVGHGDRARMVAVAIRAGLIS